MPRPATGQVVTREGTRGTTYGLRYRVGGQRYYETAQATTLEEAEDELAAIRRDIKRGTWRPPEAAPVVEVVAVETFHEYASSWLASRTPELKPRSVESLTWALSGHVLPFFARHRVDEISIAQVDAFRAWKVREREELERQRARDPRVRERGLSNSSVNQCLAVLAQILDAAIEDGHLAGANPARGRRRRLRTDRPRRSWLELNELRALLDAAGEHRALLATMAMGGLRVSEVCGLRWGAVDLANARLHVSDSKTAAGRRTVDLSPDLRDELLARKAAARSAEPGDLVFPTRTGTTRDRHNVRARVLAGAVVRANKKLVQEGYAPIVGCTNHTLRRTYASLLFEAGASPAYAMAMLGHTSATMSLEVYSRMMSRDRDTGTRLDALVRGADWAQMGTNDGIDEALVALSNDTRERDPA